MSRHCLTTNSTHFRASRFSGYHQQDSQELLRYLLDSLRSEEIYVREYLERVMYSKGCVICSVEDKEGLALDVQC